MSDGDCAFDSVIQTVGNDGKFQKRFNFLFNFVLVVLTSMPYLNIVIALAVPEHWCNVPGREYTNHTIETWKELHIPMEYDNVGKYDFSKCKMYNRTSDIENPEIIKCQDGWEFDKTWYDLTAPSQESWVCDETLHVTNAFVFSRLGEVFGTFVFGQLADAIGRRPVFFMTVVTIVLGRMLSIITAYSVPLFFLTTFIGSLPSTSVFQGPLVIAMEISKNEDRAHIAMMQCLGWTVGLCMLPLLMWVLRDWYYFMLVTTLPCFLYMFSGSFLIESPRWLASKGKTKKCVKELHKIAKVNNTKVPEDAIYTLAKVSGKEEKVYGMLALFSSWRLAKNSFLLITGWSTTTLIYYTLTLNVNNLGGNPFMNFFWQGMAELPAYIVGKFASDKFGRRWTNIGAFVGTFLGCIPILFIVHDKSNQITVAAICVFLKFSISFAYYVVNLEALEIYPTCVRQTGISIGGIVGNAFGILGPYVVLLGTEIDASYPYILSACLCLIGAVCGVFLPETLNQKLPETLAEAAVFGADQNLLGKRRKSVKMTEAEVPLKA
ncbi:PREDICTED: organic cation transporter 1-like [Nicrophorus vespilloides]|uniref:Organic cation transporter 1-like n=1 Tax=Nicrophorus vespilloides TaxID=110193 RepID=A0ABM1NKF7_NICVS|nr:PREDICTED: organic cation transporter 1-like [Nicrophorus vespilloides]